MKPWQKGAIIGFIWGINPVIISSFGSIFGIDIWNYLFQGLLVYFGLFLSIPFFLAPQIGSNYIFVFIEAPIMGAMIGASSVFLYGRWLDLKALKKGAVVGILWGIISIPLFFHFLFASWAYWDEPVIYTEKEAELLMKTLALPFLLAFNLAAKIPILFAHGLGFSSIVSVLIGALIWVPIGYLYGRWKEK